jgi:ethanolamine utilization protein EutA
MFSRLTVGYPTAQRRRPEVLERRIISRSPVLLTPFSADWNIDAGPLKALIDATFAEAGLSPDAVDTGAVIVTGEAARRDNAQRIVELFSDQAGRFVCATAGPRLEGLLAAHGSGAVARSREDALTVLHVDVGGGTTKVGLIQRGRVTDMTALNIGARLVAHDEAGRVIRLERAGDRFLRDLDYEIGIGDAIEPEARARLAARMAVVLFNVLEGKPAPWPELWVTPPIGPLPPLDGVFFSGGVSEYIYERETTAFGDLGPLLGKEIRAQAQARGYRILDTGEGIRATVIGASAYSMQLSGETIFIPEPERLPLHNLRITVAPVTWEAPVAERSQQSVAEVLAGRDAEVREAPYALVISSPPFFGYSVAQQLANGIRDALLAVPPDERPKMMVFEQNIGQVVGASLWKDLRLPCIDEVSLSELDFIDVGNLVPGETYVPVVVKSLAFEF